MENATDNRYAIQGYSAFNNTVGLQASLNGWGNIQSELLRRTFSGMTLPDLISMPILEAPSAELNTNCLPFNSNWTIITDYANVYFKYGTHAFIGKDGTKTTETGCFYLKNDYDFEADDARDYPRKSFITKANGIFLQLQAAGGSGGTVSTLENVNNNYFVMYGPGGGGGGAFCLVYVCLYNVKLPKVVGVFQDSYGGHIKLGQLDTSDQEPPIIADIFVEAGSTGENATGTGYLDHGNYFPGKGGSGGYVIDQNKAILLTGDTISNYISIVNATSGGDGGEGGITATRAFPYITDDRSHILAEYSQKAKSGQDLASTTYLNMFSNNVTLQRYKYFGSTQYLVTGQGLTPRAENWAIQPSSDPTYYLSGGGGAAVCGYIPNNMDYQNDYNSYGNGGCGEVYLTDYQANETDKELRHPLQGRPGMIAICNAGCFTIDDVGLSLI